MSVDLPSDIRRQIKARASAQGGRSEVSVLREAVIFAFRHPDFRNGRAA